MLAIRKAIGFGFALALILGAQEPDRFVGWMKATGAASGALRKMENKAVPEAVGQAERLGGVYEEMIGYWRQRNATDAVKWSEEGKAAAVQLAAAAHAGDSAKASAAFEVLNGTCKGCHDAHREKISDGHYKIK